MEFSLSWLLVPLAAAAFAAASPATIVALQSLSSPLVVAGRCGVAAVALGAIFGLALPRRLRALGRQEGLVAAASGAALGLHLILFVAGLAHTSYTAAVALVALEPVAVLIAGATCFRSYPTKIQLAGVGSAIAGALVIGLEGAKVASQAGLVAHSWTGDAFVLGAVVLYGVYYALNRTLAASGERGSDLARALVVYAAATMVALACALPAHASSTPRLPIGREALLAIAVLGIVSTLIGHTLSQVAARKLPAALAGLIAPGETFGSLAIGVALFGAMPSTGELAGAALIVLGALTVTLAPANFPDHGKNLHEGR